MDYASIIANRRTVLGLSQEELAKQLSASPARIDKWEKGEIVPNLMQVPFLCAALSLPYEAFFGVKPRKGRTHRRSRRTPSYQISYLPVMCNQTIRYYRRRRKMSPAEFAQKCQVSEHLVQKWEAGTSIPKLDMIPVICSVLGIRIWQFFE